MSPRVTLKPRHARPFFARHPWVYAGSIDSVSGSPAPGDQVELVSAEGTFIAHGLWNPDSLIRARLYSWEPVPLDDAFFRARIQAALALRQTLPASRISNARRLINSEGDHVSGLTADQFDRWLVVQFTSRALWKRRAALLQTLLDESGCDGGIGRFDRTLAKRESVTDAEPFSLGSLPEGPIEIHDTGISFELVLGSGQKTGLFLDQAANRRVVAEFAPGKRVLDLFCYAGGFALHAARAGATEVLGIDSSNLAVRIAQANAARNGLDQCVFQTGDVLETLATLAVTAPRFDLVICDPPKFARAASDLDAALRAYARLNRAALEVLAPGGILATCSCSGHVDRGTFIGMLGQVAELARRPIQVLEMRGPALDHPISVACPESDYLKCAICKVA